MPLSMIILSTSIAPRVLASPWETWRLCLILNIPAAGIRYPAGCYSLVHRRKATRSIGRGVSSAFERRQVMALRNMRYPAPTNPGPTIARSGVCAVLLIVVVIFTTYFGSYLLHL